MKYSVRNWRTFQHYKDRNPPWIKLHFTLLSSRDWVTLSDASRVLAVACMLVASRNDGEIDGSDAGLEYLQRVAYLNKKPDLNPLIESGFLECASNNASDLLANSVSETEDLTEKETTLFRGSNGSPYKPVAIQVLNFLNEKTGRAYRPVKANLDFIVGRLKDGATETELRQVIAKKTREWKGDPKMDICLRPKTLFNATNFAQYQGELLQPEKNNAMS